MRFPLPESQYHSITFILLSHNIEGLVGISWTTIVTHLPAYPHCSLAKPKVFDLVFVMGARMHINGATTNKVTFIQAYWLLK